MAKQVGIKIIAQNKKAHFNYFLSEFTECGVALVGTEIKSLRNNAPNITDAYIVFRNEEAEIVNMHIPLYKEGNIFNHDPYRARKLLLHKKEIRWFIQKSKAEGYTVVPTKIYFSNGRAKIEIALAKGKKLHDKRQTEKERDDKRLIEKTLKNF
jgi:SsrA-binding protein